MSSSNPIIDSLLGYILECVAGYMFLVKNTITSVRFTSRLPWVAFSVTVIANPYTNYTSVLSECYTFPILSSL